MFMDDATPKILTAELRWKMGSRLTIIYRDGKEISAQIENNSHAVAKNLVKLVIPVDRVILVEIDEFGLTVLAEMGRLLDLTK